MNSGPDYDIAVIGGGLAGLSAAISCAKKGMRVILFEKENYPFHKVCGEYISLESLNFLTELGLPFEKYNLPIIKRLELSAPNGNLISHTLPLGGIGISRFAIDNELARIATEANVTLSAGNRVQEVVFKNDEFLVMSDQLSPVTARVCCGAFGKRSNLDVKWKRGFVLQKAGPLNNYIGVKYHVRADHPRDLISLHNFRGGYCGVSPVENGLTCVCYLTHAQNLRNSHNNVLEMEQRVLSENSFLSELFKQAENEYDKPLVISQISFEKKEQVVNHVFMLGDAAGLIAPLCGNGMSMAMHSGKLFSGIASDFVSGLCGREQMEKKYSESWNEVFGKRLKAGRVIQSLFGKEWLTNGVIRLLKPFPSLFGAIVKQTHGEGF